MTKSLRHNAIQEAFFTPEHPANWPLLACSGAYLRVYRLGFGLVWFGGHNNWSTKYKGALIIIEEPVIELQMTSAEDI